MKFPSDAAERVARSLIDEGPATAAALGRRLGMRQPAVRKHLRSLVEAELVDTHDRMPFGPSPERGRGRPAHVYAVTGSGRAAASETYEELAIEAMRFLDRIPGAVEEFARERADAMSRHLRVAIAQRPVDEVEAVGIALTEAGYAASIEQVGDGEHAVQLCQHHCPVVDAASLYPQLCEAETEMLSEVLGRHVTRLATLAHGDGICTTLIPMHTHTDRKVLT
jgi:predicted ArsR family transcriptional regulator